MCWSNDPVRDAERHYDKQEQEMWETCPICDICGEPIQDSYAWQIGEDWMHEECAEEQYKRRLW